MLCCCVLLVFINCVVFMLCCLFSCCVVVCCSVQSKPIRYNSHRVLSPKNTRLVSPVPAAILALTLSKLAKCTNTSSSSSVHTCRGFLTELMQLILFVTVEKSYSDLACFVINNKCTISWCHIIMYKCTVIPQQFHSNSTAFSTVIVELN